MADQPDPHRFVFELDKAIRDQVIEKLEASPMLLLAKNCAPQESGIYVLYFKKKLVYCNGPQKLDSRISYC